MFVLLDFAYNLCLPSLGFDGYFATEEKEQKREIREKQKQRKEKIKNKNIYEL
jgi:hypothetical protein